MVFKALMLAMVALLGAVSVSAAGAVTEVRGVICVQHCTVLEGFSECFRDGNIVVVMHLCKGVRLYSAAPAFA